MEPPFLDRTVLIPSPAYHLTLPAIDARHPEHLSRRLLIFRCDSSSQRDAQLAALEQGLAALLQLCPILGGVIDNAPTARTGRVIAPHDGLRLVVRDLRATLSAFAELKGDNFPPHRLPYDLLMPSLAGQCPYPACTIQFSTIRGGTILTFAMSHVVADGKGTDVWMKYLADEVCGRPSSAISRGPLGLDRSLMCNITSGAPFNMKDHPGYRWSGQPLAKYPDSPLPPEVPALMRIPRPSLARLKADATDSGTNSETRPISTHDAVVALIWRTTVQVRSRRRPSPIPAHGRTYLFMPSDARRHLGLPADYVGNAVYQLMAELDLDLLLGTDGLKHAARAVRTTISRVTPDLVKSYIAAAASDPSIEWRFLDGSVGSVGVAMGTCLDSGEVLYGSEWGSAFGSVARYREAAGVGSYVLPRRPDGSVELVVSVLPDEREMLLAMDGFGTYV